ncbi:MAG TPA: HD domain-containing protein [Alphaproteobacteria bacterium]|nr:HD domain-containing protein [Alphaproteobacteria bacterium]
MPDLLSLSPASLLLPSFRMMVGVARALGLSNQASDSLVIHFMSATGQLRKFAARKEWWMTHGEEELRQGNIDPFLFSLMTSALIARHQDSQLNRMDYLKRVIKLYNAKTIEGVFSAESASEGSEKRAIISGVFEDDGLDAAKQDCLLRDIDFGTNGKLSVHEMRELLKSYHAPDKGSQGKMREEESPVDPLDIHKTFSAFTKKALYPLIQELFSQGAITQEQVVLLLCVNLHSREQRKVSEERYVDHPMAVAGFVSQFSPLFSFDEKEISLAIMAALIHDIGEKSNFSMKEDLPEIVSPALRDVALLLHKEEEESYFYDYVSVKCASSRIAALVKLCDIYHNSSDCDDCNPSFKQAYVYPIAANFLFYRLENPDSACSIKEFVVQQSICSAEQFDEIHNLAVHNRNIAVSQVAGTIPVLSNMIPVRDIFHSGSQPVTLNYANLFRNQDPALQC